MSERIFIFPVERNSANRGKTGENEPSSSFFSSIPHAYQTPSLFALFSRPSVHPLFKCVLYKLALQCGLPHFQIRHFDHRKLTTHLFRSASITLFTNLFVHLSLTYFLQTRLFPLGHCQRKLPSQGHSGDSTDHRHKSRQALQRIHWLH